MFHSLHKHAKSPWIVAVVSTMVCSAAIEGQDFNTSVGFGVGPVLGRVEGLTLRATFLAESDETNPWRFRVAPILRIEDIPSTLRRIGFEVQMEKVLADDRFRIGGLAWSVIESIEDRGLSSVESSLSMFVFHDDRRDYYETKGGSVYGMWRPLGSRLQVALEGKFEQHRPEVPGQGTTLIKNGDAWRAQPLAAEGLIGSVTGSVRYDTRPRLMDDPFNGWFVRAELQQGIDGDLALPTLQTPGGNPLGGVPTPDNQFRRGMIDVRRYNSVANLGVNLRAVASGSLKNRGLPVQFQHAPGGTGTLPGYELFTLDCGARTNLVGVGMGLGQLDFYPAYGCDQYVLFQTQIEGYLGFRIGGDPARPQNAWQPGGVNFSLIPKWALFFNASRGWTDGGFAGMANTDWLYDAGGGIMLGDIGVYTAYPLTGPEKTVRGVVRFGRRF